MLNKQAEQYVNKVLKNAHSTDEPFVLYLRSFTGEGKMRAKDPASISGYDTMYLETRLARAFRKSKIIGFFSTSENTPGSSPFELPGTSPYSSEFNQFSADLFYVQPGMYHAKDEDWFKTFKSLASAASVIISIPLDFSEAENESATISELAHIADAGMLKKCLFFMPPEQNLELAVKRTLSGGLTTTSYETSKLSKMWESTRRKLERKNISFPEFLDNDDGVLLFTIDGNKIRIVPYSCNLIKRWKAAF